MKQVRCTRKSNTLHFEIPTGTEDVKKYVEKKLKSMGFDPNKWTIDLKK